MTKNFQTRSFYQLMVAWLHEMDIQKSGCSLVNYNQYKKMILKVTMRKNDKKGISTVLIAVNSLFNGL